MKKWLDSQLMSRSRVDKLLESAPRMQAVSQAALPAAIAASRPESSTVSVLAAALLEPCGGLACEPLAQR